MSWSELPENVRLVAAEVLTRKQLDVLKLWVNGNSYVTISLKLGISEATVRGHLRRALQKLQPYYTQEATHEPATSTLPRLDAAGGRC